MKKYLMVGIYMWGDMAFIYGSLSDRQIQNQRDTITKILLKYNEK